MSSVRLQYDRQIKRIISQTGYTAFFGPLLTLLFAISQLIGIGYMNGEVSLRNNNRPEVLKS